MTSKPPVPSLDELRALSERATPKQWGVLRQQQTPVIVNYDGTVVGRLEIDDDARFIVAAVNYVRTLLSTPPTARGVEGDEARRGLHVLLQLALDEMQNVVEAINDNHENKRWPVKYGTPYGAINGMIKVREDILAQCAAWGIEVSPHRKAATLPAHGVEPLAAALEEMTEAFGPWKAQTAKQERALESARAALASARKGTP